MNMNLLKHNNTPWLLYAEKHEMHMKQEWCDQARMMWSSKDGVKKQTMAWSNKQSLQGSDHNAHSQLDIQANKLNANHLHAQHLTNA